jgi:hypothetical protein
MADFTVGTRPAVIKIEFEAHISRDRSVKIEFARPLSEDERKIMEVHGWSQGDGYDEEYCMG